MVSRGVRDAGHCAPLHTRRRASSGRLTCRGTSTYARGRGRSEPPSGRPDCNSRFGDGLTVGADRSIPAGHKSGGKKTLESVTTRSRNIRIRGSLRSGLRPSAALPLVSGMARFDFRRASALGLTALGLPAADQTQALRVLAVALIPAPRLVSLAAALAETHPPARFSPAGLGTCFSSRLIGAHGSCRLPWLSPGKTVNLPRAFSFKKGNHRLSVYRRRRARQ